MPITILIAEDQRLFRQSLRLLLERERDLSVVAEAMDGRQAFDLAVAHRPNIVLMDVDMPRLDGITATKLIGSCVPESKVLMLSVHDDDARIVAAVQAGACGYILKDADHQEFLRIIRATHRGEPVRSAFMPDGFAKKAVALAGRQEATGASALVLLTDREQEILACAAAGRSNKDIADQLCVSLDTVKTHLHHIYQKLNVSGRVEAVLTYLGHG
ncbi:MAG: Transcriptional regulatory protein DegU [Nitrospirae bacterium]|nr:MAG: LuxR family response regulator [Nitrospira sp. OLB3]MBV6468731.1 Transcriptional regulatory protein DegU [Nitrospirota bacterium]MCE7964064.1 DNA-binding response regulator [Nitrospira sp. NTP2]MCK6492745.1 response regulator transcription factor [Nitrospira sp.]MEB2337086.1 response regulator transcription factor [Nitrospirales bacterium]